MAFQPDPRLRAPNGTRQAPPPSHPSRGGNPYSDDMRQQVLEMYLQGQDLDSPEIRALRDQWKFPHLDTCQRWIDIYHETGDICPKRATGNRYSQREILGDTLEKLALFRIVFPKATLAECRAYLYNLNPNVAPHSNSQVHRAEMLLGLTRKASSTTADQTYTPANLLKREAYWSQPSPLGVHGVPAWDMILDVDVAGFKLEHQNRKFGKSVTRLRCDEAGVYLRNWLKD